MFKLEYLIYLAPVIGVIALIFAGIKAVSISKKDAGTERMKEIGSFNFQKQKPKGQGHPSIQEFTKY